ncbi:MAG TPA: HAMP domain-containing protein, partial [Dissulfurispiraceae bacterium]|nr:HAMP domain-containing protein [Dissulfurispiraceae bacterium]
MMRNFNIGWKYALYLGAMSLVIFIVMLVGTTLFIWKSAHDLKMQFGEVARQTLSTTHQTQMRNLAEYISNHIFTSLHQLDIDYLNILIRDLRRDLPILAFRVANDRGVVLTDGTEENRDFGTQLVLDRDALGESPVIVEPHERGYRVLFLVGKSGYTIGYGEMIFSDQPVREALEKREGKIGQIWEAFKIAFLQVALLGVLCIGFLSIAISFVLSRSLTEPLIRLRDAARLIATGDLRTRVEVRSQDEMGELAGAFNGMAEDLQRITVSKQYVDSILGSMSDALLIISQGGTITSVNRAACELTECGESGLVGMNIRDMFHDSGGLPAWTQGEEPEGRLVNMEAELFVREGKRVPVLLSISPIRDASQGSRTYAVCIRDITTIREAERALRE